jgi:very-short-patch-repair endonuclease
VHYDRLIAALAAKQHGVVAARQLAQLGLGSDAILHRARSGQLHRLHQGVYAVGHRKLTREGHWMAAVLAYGPGAVLSQRSAAALWGFSAGAAQIDVTVGHATRSRPGVRAHSANLHPEDVATRHNIPLTSVSRTILDLAARLDESRLIRVIETADRHQLFDLRALDRAVARQPRRAGVRRLRAVLGDYRDPEDTRSGLERDFLSLVVAAKLPRPQVNVLVAGVLVDCYWPESRLVTELDSRGFHLSPRAFERDRVRDAILQRNGLRVLRITRNRLENEPGRVLEDVRALIRPPRA